MENPQLISIIPLSRLRPQAEEPIDSVREARTSHGRSRNHHLIWEAQTYWHNMARFRKDRERNKRYTYGEQWQDRICVDGKMMSEEDYIISQGNVPLKNNLIKRLVNNVLGVYRSQTKEPICVARDRDEQNLGETMSTVLQCNMQMNRMSEILSRSMEEFLISGFVVHSKRFGWRNDKLDCWTDYVNPNNIFIDTNTRDFRGWDLSMIGEIHDLSFGELCSRFAQSNEDYHYLKQVYKQSTSRDYLRQHYREFGAGDEVLRDLDFLHPRDTSVCRVIELWRKETKERYRCYDPLKGELYKIDTEDYELMVIGENERRRQQGLEAGISEEEIPFIEAEWFMDSYWYYYFLTPLGDILDEGETPYAHKSHPYVFKAYPFIDGEIHSFVSNVIDQQRYTNRLIMLYDWIMRASAKGVLLVPEESIPDGMRIEDFADEWSKFNGVIQIKTKGGVQLPQQISNNATNVGISELLGIQLKFFEDISGIHGALQGKPGHAGMSSSLYSQQVQNATTSLLDLLDTFAGFVQEGAYKDVKNIQQFYDKKRVFNIAGKRSAEILYDPKKIKDVEFDLSIVEGTSTPAYRQIANDFLLQIWQAQQISLEQLLQHGDFPFADELLQSIKSEQQKLQDQQAMAQGLMHQGTPPPTANATPIPEDAMAMNGGAMPNTNALPSE